MIVLIVTAMSVPSSLWAAGTLVLDPYTPTGSPASCTIRFSATRTKVGENDYFDGLPWLSLKNSGGQEMYEQNDPDTRHCLTTIPGGTYEYYLGTTSLPDGTYYLQAKSDWYDEDDHNHTVVGSNVQTVTVKNGWQLVEGDSVAKVNSPTNNASFAATEVLLP